VGHFGKLYRKQGTEFLKSVKEMRDKLSDPALFSLTYPPRANRIIAFFKKHPVLPSSEMDEWAKELRALETKMEGMRNFLLNSFRGAVADNVSYSRLAFDLRFPLPEQDCREYLQLD
jgi:hypothetical protein